ncbi:MAG TPA: L-aspartate oxidase [Bacteroidales bacterium]|nr:L-aspartate oxidase [Bacteroidales bacterium]HPS17995.1 L-aspartate oxidase [Bacteroidales bacterium]
MQIKTDFLVIGSGIAGLSYALKVAEYGKVIIITKEEARISNTSLAQGGIAAVMYNPDTYEKHIQDTIEAGAGLCNENIVRITITESKERIDELVKWGTNFDKTVSGRYDLAKEGGHSEYRVLHHKDNTGKEIIRALLEQARNHPNIEFYENYFAVDLITQHHLGQIITKKTPNVTCFGAYVLNPKTNLIDSILSKFTLMATGGGGNVYSITSNPPIATGDGVAMVHRARGKIENMEFIQFHPTMLYNPSERPSFLITEALRGFGAVLKTTDGNEFMEKYDRRKSLAPRDIVARAIDNEMKISGDDYVYLDCRHLNKNDVINHFPNIYAKCLSIGIDLSKDMIPVIPGAHYSCGGILTNELGRSSINNLYAVGECACTGLHGANRLASNSLLEALVFSHRAAVDSIGLVDSVNINEEIPSWDAEGTVLNEEMVLITQAVKELQFIMSYYVGIVRSNLRLKRALDRLQIIYRETEDLYEKSIVTRKICELRNLIDIAYQIIKSAMRRKQSLGLHYSLDYPSVKKK